MTNRAPFARALMVSVLIAAGCGKGGDAAPAATEVDIARVIDDWHDAAAKADETRYFAHFAPNGVFLGTDATERWSVQAFREYARPHFAKGKAWAFKSVRRGITIHPSGAVAWFDEDLATEKLGPQRGSGVLVRDGAGPWKIAQYNLATTIPNERFGDVRRLLESAPSAPPATSR